MRDKIEEIDKESREEGMREVMGQKRIEKREESE